MHDWVSGVICDATLWIQLLCNLDILQPGGGGQSITRPLPRPSLRTATAYAPCLSTPLVDGLGHLGCIGTRPEWCLWRQLTAGWRRPLLGRQVCLRAGYHDNGHLLGARRGRRRVGLLYLFDYVHRRRFQTDERPSCTGRSVRKPLGWVHTDTSPSTGTRVDGF